MAERRLRPLPAPSSLEDDDRFSAPPAQIQETPTVGEGFEVEADHLGVGIVKKIFQDIAFIHIDLVPHGTDLAHTHRGIAHDIDEEYGGEHAALHDEGDSPRDEFLLLLRPWIHEGKDMTVDAIDEPHAVGSPEPDAGASRNIGELFLQAFSFRTGFGKTARFDDDAADAPSRRNPPPPRAPAGRGRRRWRGPPDRGRRRRRDNRSDLRSSRYFGLTG